MFELSKYLIDEASEIASKMADTGEQSVAIWSTDFFVTRSIGKNSVILHRFTIADLDYFIVQGA